MKILGFVLVFAGCYAFTALDTTMGHVIAGATLDVAGLMCLLASHELTIMTLKEEIERLSGVITHYKNHKG